MFAALNGLPLSVKGGGHGVAGDAVCDGGVMLDLSQLRAIHIDPARRVATAQPGLTLGELDRATQAFGLATPTGIMSGTGLSGLTLGGGLGWLRGKHGLTCDNLLAAELVTADGRRITASAHEHRTCSGGCAAPAPTSAWSRPSRSGCIRSGPCSRACSLTRPRRPEPRCGSTTSSPPPVPTS